jgi:hypothetical protein
MASTPLHQAQEPCLEDGGVRDTLLRNDTRSSDHGETAIVDLFVLHLEKAGGILRLELHGIEAKVAGQIVVTESERQHLRILPALVGADCGNIRIGRLSSHVLRAYESP